MDGSYFWVGLLFAALVYDVCMEKVSIRKLEITEEEVVIITNSSSEVNVRVDCLISVNLIVPYLWVLRYVDGWRLLKWGGYTMSDSVQNFDGFVDEVKKLNSNFKVIRYWDQS